MGAKEGKMKHLEKLKLPHINCVCCYSQLISPSLDDIDHPLGKGQIVTDATQTDNIDNLDTEVTDHEIGTL